MMFLNPCTVYWWNRWLEKCDYVNFFWCYSCELSQVRWLNYCELSLLLKIGGRWRWFTASPRRPPLWPPTPQAAASLASATPGGRLFGRRNPPVISAVFGPRGSPCQRAGGCMEVEVTHTVKKSTNWRRTKHPGCRKWVNFSIILIFWADFRSGWWNSWWKKLFFFTVQVSVDLFRPWKG